MVINLFGGPGCGKSSLASYIYSYLKSHHYSVGLLQEFATQLILNKNIEALKKQYWVITNQLYNQELLEESYNIVITDSPILLGEIYDIDENSVTKELLKVLMTEKFKEKENINIFIRRDLKKEFSLDGRVHDLSESLKKDVEIENMLKSHSVIDLIEINITDEKQKEQLIKTIIDRIGKDNGKCKKET